MIKKDDPEFVLEAGRHVPPHILIAAETVCENHRSLAGASYMDIVASDSRHMDS